MPHSPSLDPTIIWTPGSAHELAQYNRLLDQQVVEVNNVFWRRVRPFFYRPLLPFQAYAPTEVVAPPDARLGGFQHAVPEGQAANSVINVLLFDCRAGYSAAELDYNRRRQIRIGQAAFAIRPIPSADEFREKAYPVYLSFYERTHYFYGARRRERAYFSRWADGLFQLPHLVILGGYRGNELGGVSLSIRIGDTVIYSTFFCDTESLRLNLSDLMLHAVRGAAGTDPGITQLCVGTFKGRTDDFYLLRGCRCVAKPARLYVNPLVRGFARRWMPERFARMTGSAQPT